MKNKKSINHLRSFSAILFLMLICWGTSTVCAFELGKTYDKTNYQEIENLLIPCMLDWVKNGEFILKTEKLEYEFKQADAYIAASRENEGKYDTDTAGMLIDKKTGAIPTFYYGDPFPTVDLKDPKAGEKIMANHCASRYHTAAHYSAGRVAWINTGGRERELLTAGDYLHYMNRRGGPVPNPSNFLDLSITYLLEPYDIRGTTIMGWIYNDNREDTVFNYVPMIRRVVRSSAAARSDPFAGSDACTDDSDTFAGKAASFTWKYIGETQVLLPFMNSKIIPTKTFPDGSIQMVYPEVKAGWEVPGWQGVGWCPANVFWTPRDCWIVDGNPKDPYYNYGRQTFYVDKQKVNSVVKVVYDHAGAYWKTVFSIAPFCQTPDGDNTVGYSTIYIVIDDRTHHATFSKVCDPPMGHPNSINMPIDKIGPDHFTTSTILQLSK
jgi:hypothetical protein